MTPPPPPIFTDTLIVTDGFAAQVTTKQSLAIAGYNYTTRSVASHQQSSYVMHLGAETLQVKKHKKTHSLRTARLIEKRVKHRHQTHNKALASPPKSQFKDQRHDLKLWSKQIYSMIGVDWKCWTWKWRTIKIAGHENAGHEYDGTKMTTGRETAGEKVQF